MDANDGGGNPRPKKYKVIPKDLRQPRQLQLNLLAQRAYNDKKANNGKLPRNYYSSIMTPVAAITAPLQITYDDVRNELRKIETKEKNAANNAPTIGLPMLNVIDESSSSAESSTVSTIAAESSSSAESSTSPVSAEASTVVESSVTAESSAVPTASRLLLTIPKSFSQHQKMSSKQEHKSCPNEIHHFPAQHPMLSRSRLKGTFSNKVQG